MSYQDKEKDGKGVDCRRMFAAGLALVGAGVALTVSVGPVGVALLSIGGLLMMKGARHRDERKDRWLSRG